MYTLFVALLVCNVKCSASSLAWTNSVCLCLLCLLVWFICWLNANQYQVNHNWSELPIYCHSLADSWSAVLNYCSIYRNSNRKYSFTCAQQLQKLSFIQSKWMIHRQFMVNNNAVCTCIFMYTVSVLSKNMKSYIIPSLNLRWNQIFAQTTALRYFILFSFSNPMLSFRRAHSVWLEGSKRNFDYIKMRTKR